MAVAEFDIHGRLERSLREVEAMVGELRLHEDPRVRLMAAAEMRKHIALARDTLRWAMQAEALAEFQAGVLEALASAGVVVRRQVMGLFEARGAEEVSHTKTQRRKGEED